MHLSFFLPVARDFWLAREMNLGEPIERAVMPMRHLIVALMTLLLSSAGWSLSQEQEIQIGAQAAAKFEQQHGLVTDPAMVGRLNRISQRLLANARRRDLPWRFKVINVDAFNAAAFPGGFIYATKGLMQGLNDEELAFVIGHEIGHVDYRHSVKQLESAQMRRIGLIAIAAGAGGGNVDQATASLVGLADGVIGSQHSQADESQSDRYGMRMMALAGYDPAFALSGLQKLASQSSGGTPGFLNTLVGSHPLPKERVAQGEGLIMNIPFRAQALDPVNRPSAKADNIFRDATDALEYTLSLLGHGHRDSLQQAAEQLAEGLDYRPRGTRLVRVSSPRSEGLSGLENRLLARPEFDLHGMAFGAAVVKRGGGQVEAVVLLQGGRR